jgi:adenylyltransferase/sulfurtransferase
MRETSPFTPLESERYGRHMVLPEVGPEGQARLREASVALVGAGGLGSPLALYLAAAGVGRIGLIDDDAVDLTNLQRQVLYGTRDVGVAKVRAARERLADVNPHVRLETHAARLTADNALDLLADYDVVADGTDNFATRYVVNDSCVLLGKANVYGSVFRFEGQAAVFGAPGGPCYRCLYPDPPEPGAVPSCAEGGVLGVLPGIIGCVQAAEVLKRILGAGESLVGRLLLFDALEMRFRELRVARDPACPVCGDHPTIRTPADVREACVAPATAAAPEEEAVAERVITPRTLHDRLLAGERIQVLDVRMPVEWRICRIDGAIPIPMHELPARLHELDRDRETVVYCHVGVRSALVTRWLVEQGFARVRNLTGGIDSWAREVDPAVPRY